MPSLERPPLRSGPAAARLLAPFGGSLRCSGLEGPQITRPRNPPRALAPPSSELKQHLGDAAARRDLPSPALLGFAHGPPQGLTAGPPDAPSDSTKWPAARGASRRGSTRHGGSTRLPPPGSSSPCSVMPADAGWPFGGLCAQPRSAGTGRLRRAAASPKCCLSSELGSEQKRSVAIRGRVIWGPSSPEHRRAPPKGASSQAPKGPPRIGPRPDVEGTQGVEGRPKQ
jgi:hypothetical protein